MKNIFTFAFALCLLGIGQVTLGESPMKIEKQYDIPFSTQEVYSAWISSDTVIPPATRMDIKPVVGGHYRLIMDSPEFQSSNQGKFLRIEPTSRVTYTWEWNGDGEVSTIDVTFEPSSAGTRIEITHSGFEKDESVINHTAGWDSYMEGFTAYLSGK